MAKPKRGLSRQERETVRCAIYTRKSTEEGLEQEFNSLDAQREACAAYILSQRHEGWVELPELYDDGGYSGGNMERPALKQLLTDVAAGKVDVIVLYKIDRLTRSLADFARIVEVLDGAEASFVSVTQSFNTTTSMGRLTLNVLLSFAQFEREVTGERIRDKVAASKAKGMWMGGVVPLGYDVKERKLIINDAEAETVRMIFRRYADLGSTVQLTDELHKCGIVSKQRCLGDGTSYGGRTFSRGALTHLLKNRVYIGEVTHRDHIYAGEHLPIIDRDLWEKVQALITSNTRERRTSSRATEQSLLTGIIRDGFGRPMTPTHATKGTRRYRYYVSRTEDAADPHRVWRLPAPALEQQVLARLSAVVGDGTVLTERLGRASGETIELIRRRSSELATRMASLPASAGNPILRELGVSVQVRDDRLAIGIDGQALLARVLGDDARWFPVELLDDPRIAFDVPVQLRRRGQELRLVFAAEDRAAPQQTDSKLVELLVKAHQARDVLFEQGAELPTSERPHLTRLARLSYLAPDIIGAIIEGRQPSDLSTRRLLRTANLPTCWRSQREALGFHRPLRLERRVAAG